MTTLRWPLRSAGALIAGTIVAGGIVALWVWLTLRTGLTFHFHPLLVAASTALTSRLALARPLGRQETAVSLATGLLAVTAGWVILAAFDATPRATFVDGQPGGTALETIVFAAVGAWLGARFARRP